MAITDLSAAEGAPLEGGGLPFAVPLPVPLPAPLPVPPGVAPAVPAGDPIPPTPAPPLSVTTLPSPDELSPPVGAPGTFRFEKEVHPWEKGLVDRA